MGRRQACDKFLCVHACVHTPETTSIVRMTAPPLEQFWVTQSEFKWYSLIKGSTMQMRHYNGKALTCSHHQCSLCARWGHPGQQPALSDCRCL